MHSNHVTITHNNTRGKTVVMVTDIDDVRAISFGSVTNLKIGLEYRLDFYCHVTDRNETGLQFLKAHLLRHLILLNQKEGDKMLIVDVVIPKDMDAQNLVGCYESAGLIGFSALETKKAYFVDTSIPFSRMKAKL